MLEEHFDHVVVVKVRRHHDGRLVPLANALLHRRSVDAGAGDDEKPHELAVVVRACDGERRVVVFCDDIERRARLDEKIDNFDFWSLIASTRGL